MGKRQQRIQLTALDAVTLGIVPPEHRTAATAAFLIDNSNYFSPREQLDFLAKTMTDSEESAQAFVRAVLYEMSRQLKLKSRRIAARKKHRKMSAMGSQVDRDTRVNRVCRPMFGDPAKWLPIGPVTPSVVTPHFSWFKRMPDGVMVAGVEAFTGSTMQAGFVFRISRSSTTRFARLPATSRNLESLLSFLGLHPRLADSKSLRIDWSRKAFVIDGTNHLPWVYP